MSTPLRDLLNGILFDGPTRAGFTTDPDSFLRDHGWSDLEAADVSDALAALVDDLPVAQAVAVAPAAAGAPTEAGGLDGAIDGLLHATASVDAHLDPHQLFDPADGIDATHRSAEALDADSLDADLFRDAVTAAPDGTDDTDDLDRLTDVDRVTDVDEIAEVDDPQDLDDVTEIGEFDAPSFDVTPDLDELDTAFAHDGSFAEDAGPSAFDDPDDPDFD